MAAWPKKPAGALIDEAIERMKGGQDIRTLARILQRLATDLGDIESVPRLPYDQYGRVRSALEASLGASHVFEEAELSYWGGDEELDSPLSELVDSLYRLDIDVASFMGGNDQAQLLRTMLMTRQPIEVSYDSFDDQPDALDGELLTVDWFERMQTLLTANGDETMCLELSIPGLIWRVTSLGSGQHELNFLEFGQYAGPSATMYVTPQTEITERDGYLMLSHLKMAIRVPAMLDDYPELPARLKDAFDEFPERMLVGHLTINQTTRQIESFVFGTCHLRLCS